MEGNPESTIGVAPRLVAYAHGFLRWLEQELAGARVYVSRSLLPFVELRDESDRLGGISEGLLEDSHRLRHDAAELKINVQNCRAKIPPAFRSYSNRP